MALNVPESDWDIVEPLFHQALSLPRAEQQAFLRGIEPPPLRDEVASLLASSPADDTGLPFGGPASVSARAADPGHELPADQRLGAWRIVELIGRGGMGEVYRCERADEAFDMVAAAKVVKSDAPSLLDRFDDERRIVASLDHPAICRLLDAGTVAGRPYMITEYVAGRTIAEHVMVEGLGLEAVLALFDEVCAAVSYAHGRSVIHRDLKPGNILVGAQGRVKLLDFGIARLMDPANATTSTQAPMTVAYAAPEQLLGRAPSPATDIHALGVVLYELLTDCLPWGPLEGVPIPVLIQKIQNDDAPPLATTAAAQALPRIAPGLLAGDLEKILTRALAKAPEQRYATVDELREDLNRFRQGAPIRADQPPANRPAAVEPIGQQAAQRRQLTVLWCRLADPKLADEMDPEAYRELLQRLQETVGAVVKRMGGQTAHVQGDAMLIAFGTPHARDDDAERAVRCGLEIVDALQPQDEPSALPVAIGIHTGPVVVEVRRSGPPELSMGATTKLAEQLHQIAGAQSVVISAATARLVTGLFLTAELPPDSAAVAGEAARQVLGVSRFRTRLQAAETLTPFVGRSQELALLQDRRERSAEGDGQAVLITAEPGVGKSRLLLAFRESLPHDGSWRDCQCAALQRSSSWQPIIEMLARESSLDGADEARLRLEAVEESLLSAGIDPTEALPLFAPLFSLHLQAPHARSPYGPEKKRERTLALLADWLMALSRQQPLVLVIEDLHWADPSTIDLIPLLLERLPGNPLMLVMTARPEFRTDWDMTHLRLQAMRPAESESLLRHLLHGEPADEALIPRLITRAGGVPLFLEELVSHWNEAGRAAVATEDIPATLQDSLSARIDRLGDTRPLLQLCSVVGREVPHSLLLRIAEMNEAELIDQLAVLTDSQLLTRRGSPPEASYVFRHALIQDCAYNALLRKTRAALHQRVARALSVNRPGDAPADPAVVAAHFAEGERPADAIPYLEAAAEQAEQAADLEQAARFCEQALDLHAADAGSDESMAREMALRLRLVRCLGLKHGYGHDIVTTHLERARALAPQISDPLLLGTFHILNWTHCWMHRGDLLAAAHSALASAQEHKHPFFESMGHCQMGLSLVLTGARCREALEHYRMSRAVGHGVVNKALAQLTRLDPVIFSNLGSAYCLGQLGQLDQAREAVEQTRRYAEELDLPMLTGSMWGMSAQILMSIEADPRSIREAAENSLAEASRHGSRDSEQVTRFILGSALLREGRADEARETMTATWTFRPSTELMWPSIGFADLALACIRSGNLSDAQSALDEALRIAREDNERIYLANIHRVQGDLVLARDQAPEAAEAHYRRAIDVAREQELKLPELLATTALCSMLRDQGRRDEARRLLAPLHGGFREGLDMPALVRARELLTELRPAGLHLDELLARMRRSRWQRHLGFAGLVLRMVAGRARHRLTTMLMTPAQRARRAAILRGREAQTMAATLGDMKGVAMKVGQIVAFTNPGLDPDTRAALESLQADAPTMAFDLVRDTIEQELGGPLESLFETFDAEPVAAASIGQVHRAVTTDGTEVAVKVQFPGLARAIDSDLDNTRAFRHLMRLVAPSMQIEPLLEEMRKRLREELDYRFEARNQQLFHDLFDGHPGVRIPAVFPELSTQRVLTTAFVRGRTLNEIAGADQDLKNHVAETIYRFAMGASIRFSVFNGDPHPGNYLVDPDGKVWFLDYGCTKFWPLPFVGPWMRYLHAVQHSMPDEVYQAATEMGLCRDDPRVDRELLLEFAQLMAEPFQSPGNHRLSWERVSLILRQSARPSGRFASLQRYRNMPPDMLLMMRYLFGITAIMADLEASGPWQAISAEYAYGDPPATALGVEESEFRQCWYRDRQLDPSVLYQRTHDGLTVLPRLDYLDLPRHSQVRERVVN